MEIRNIFDRVTRSRACSVNEFLDAYNDIVSMLCAEFGEQKVYLRGAARMDAKTIDSPDSVMDVYAPAIREGVLWKLNGDPNGRAYFEKTARDAYKTVCMNRAYGRCFNIRLTNEPYPIPRGAQEGETNVRKQYEGQ